MEILKNQSLRELNTWLVGGKAEHLCFPESEGDIREALTLAKKNQWPVTVLSGGSNVLISDDGIEGLVINLKKFSGLDISSESETLRVVAKSGTSKSELLKLFLKERLAPAIFLAGIPGDVGGGVVMNAGVAESISPREFTEITESFTVIPFDDPSATHTYQHDDVQWSYRHCRGWQAGVITTATLCWPRQKREDILTVVREANKIRLQKQPLDLPSCGSVFVNPPGHKAAQLTQSCGLKGFQIGDAQVSLKHANFIVNLGRATASEIWSVIRHVQETVQSQTGVKLTTEVLRLGKWKE